MVGDTEMELASTCAPLNSLQCIVTMTRSQSAYLISGSNQKTTAII